MESDRFPYILTNNVEVNTKTSDLQSSWFDDDHNIHSKSLHPKENHPFDLNEAEISRNHPQAKNYYQSDGDSNRPVSLEKNETENYSTADTYKTNNDVQNSTTLEQSAQATTQHVSVSQSITQSSGASSDLECLPEHLKGIDSTTKSNVIQGFINSELTELSNDVPSASYLNTNNRSYLRKAKKTLDLKCISVKDRDQIIDYFQRKEEVYRKYRKYVLAIPNSSGKEIAINRFATVLADKDIKTFNDLEKAVDEKNNRSDPSKEELNVFLYFAKRQFTPTLDYKRLLKKAVLLWWRNVYENSMLNITKDVLKKVHYMLENFGKNDSQTAQRSVLDEELTENLSREERLAFIASL